jgi:predicted SnoaL-like aldol condensation-catalyzing enzyme
MDHTTESKNKERVLEAFDTLFNKRDYKAAEKFWSPNYIQHSTHIAPGGEGLFDLVKSSFQLSNMKRDWLGYVAGTQPPPRR